MDDLFEEMAEKSIKLRERYYDYIDINPYAADDPSEGLVPGMLLMIMEMQMTILSLLKDKKLEEKENWYK